MYTVCDSDVSRQNSYYNWHTDFTNEVLSKQNV